MSYNLRHGEGTDNILDLSRAAAIINSVAPDICGLQEVDNYCTRTDSVNQTIFIAQKTNMVGTFGKFMDFQNGEYGMATLSRKPLISTHVLQLPDALYEPRSSIVHEIEIAEKCIIAFANVHFDWINNEEGSANRVKQAKVLIQYLDQLQRPIIITGDFNCSPVSPTMQLFAEAGFEFVEKGNDNLSFQGTNPSEIDHLIFRNHKNIKFTPVATVLLKEPIISDHRPLVVDLKISY